MGGRRRSRPWLSELEATMDNAGELVEVILKLTGWTQVRFVHELRRAARSLHEPEPTGLDAVTVNRWRRGRQSPSPYYRRLLHHLYVSVCDGSPRPSAVPAHRLIDHEAEDVKRRRFLTYLAVLAESTLVDPDRLDSALSSRTGMDRSLLDGLEAVTRSYARRWHSVPPEVLLPVIRHHCAALHELQLRSYPPAIGRRIRSLAAEATALLGWVVYLTGDRTTSDAYYALAREMALDVRDEMVSGFVLVARSFLYSTLFGGPREAASLPARLLDEAVEVSTHTSSPYLKAFALRRRAEERAVRNEAGDAAAVQRDLESADAVFAAARTRDDGFFHYTDQGRLAGTRGTCATLLGNVDEAVRVLSQVLSTTPPSLAAERSTLLTDLAAAYAQRAEVEYACELLGRSVLLGHSSDANRIRRIVGVRQTYLHRWEGVPSVRLLDEQLRLHLTDTM
jgi:hypothetical protein